MSCPILFHPELTDREFGSHLLSVTRLTAWAAQHELDIVTQPPIGKYQFVQVEALLCAIERAACESTPEAIAVSIIGSSPHLEQDRAASLAPCWLVGADAHQQWRRVLNDAVAAGELALLQFGSKLPVHGATGVINSKSPPARSGQADAGWKAMAQARAFEIIARDKAKALYPSQPDIAHEIARDFRRDGVTGQGGKPLAWDTIKRHALNGISSAKGKRQSTLIARGK